MRILKDKYKKTHIYVLIRNIDGDVTSFVAALNQAFQFKLFCLNVK